MKIALRILFLIFTFQCSAQTNIVPNGSFEQYSNCPDQEGQIFRANGWFMPTGGTSDYYNSCNTLPYSNNYSVPFNCAALTGMSFQEAHTGNAYAGFAAKYS